MQVYKMIIGTTTMHASHASIIILFCLDWAAALQVLPTNNLHSLQINVRQLLTAYVAFSATNIQGLLVV